MESKKAENVEEPEKKPLKRKFDKKAEVNNEVSESDLKQYYRIVDAPISFSPLTFHSFTDH